MAWRAYEVVLRLRSPLHSGWRKVGNLQMTRPYVTGRMLWGALSMRLTRDSVNGTQPANNSQEYQEVGKQVHKTLAFTYFYPALKNGSNYRVYWPWENEANFRHRFLGSYVSTALSYPQQAATEGSLHEVEFLSPYTMDDGEPVFLFGYIFEKNGCSLKWKEALNKLQLGGERGYGWGMVEPVKCQETQGEQLFDGEIEWSPTSSGVILRVDANRHIVAHVMARDEVNIKGEIEPLVGRGRRSSEINGKKYSGHYVDFTAICFVPGSRVSTRKDFLVGEFGVWRNPNKIT